jgi:hypothetical protein
MALSNSNETFVNAIFQSAVKSIQESNYDLRSFTKSKVEVGLTALLATGLMASAPDFHAYVEVPTNESIGTGLEEVRISRDSKRKKEQTWSDLIVMNRHSPNWEDPKFYLEFKFKQNYDLEWFNLGPKKEEPKIKLVKNYVENLSDLKKLSQFKESHKGTICIQGFYICFNPESKKYNDNGRGPESNIISFIRDYTNPELRTSNHEKFLKSISRSTDESSGDWKKLLIDEKLKTCEILFCKDIRIAQEQDFWLSLVLFEITGY